MSATGRPEMTLADVGILGTGVWQGPVVENDYLGPDYAQKAQVRDPYKGLLGDDGVVRIAGMEFHPDKHPRTIAAIEKSFRDPYRGTRRRRFFPPEMKVSDAETDAARRAIADAGLLPADIDALFVQSFLPDQLQPKNDAVVAHNLGLTNAMAFGVDTICNSAISQMHVAGLMVGAGHARHVVCIQSAPYSRVSDPGTASSVQEADLAAAFVVGRRAGARASFSWRVDGRLHDAIRLEWSAPVGSPRRRYFDPAPERLLIRFDPLLQAQVMSEIGRNTLVVCHEALARAGMRIEDIDCFVSHQPMSWYAAFMEDLLGLRDGVTYSSFEEYACVNSVSIPASLHEARRAGRIAPGSKVLVFGPAAGYTFAAMALVF